LGAIQSMMVQPVINDVAVAFGRALRARRKAQHISMTAAAEVAGMSRLTWHRLEKGETGVAWEFVLAAARALGLEIRWSPGNEHPINGSQAAPVSFDDWLPLTIRLDDFPGLRRLAWHIRDGARMIGPREAWELYERNRRHLDYSELSAAEKTLISALGKVYGSIDKAV
jgi:transcriptional regulator with XRE-family HTH domain